MNLFSSGMWRTSSYQTDGPGEDELVVVKCQVMNGQPMTDLDDPQPSQPPGWPVWDRLEDGRYIPDVWTDLPKDVAAKRPANGLPTC